MPVALVATTFLKSPDKPTAGLLRSEIKTLARCMPNACVEPSLPAIRLIFLAPGILILSLSEGVVPAALVNVGALA